LTEVKNISKIYDKNYAVKDLSFKTEKGKVYGFLGPNGAGKSTTLNIMTGCLSATEGTVEIDGLDIYKDRDEAKKKIGFLPEIPPLYTDMTPKEFLSFVADAKGFDRAYRDSQVEELLTLCSLKHVEDRLIRNLSKGYRQRVGIAQALVGDPDIVILDEPMVGLDPKQLIETREIISSLKEERTVILSSHILSEVEEICDSLIIISKGQLVAQGTLEEISERYITVNSLELKVKGDTGRIRMSLNGIDEISFYEIKEEGEYKKLHIEYRKESDIKERLFFEFSSLGYPIVSMVNTTMSLEDVFLKLTSDETTYEEEEKPRTHDHEKNEEEEEYLPLFGNDTEDTN
jgi:ABC-2 type transport system ATP-binding protein